MDEGALASGAYQIYRYRSDDDGNEDNGSRPPSSGQVPRPSVDEIKYRQGEEENERMIIPGRREIEFQHMPKSPAHAAAGARDPRQLVKRTAGQKKPYCENAEEEKVEEKYPQRSR